MPPAAPEPGIAAHVDAELLDVLVGEPLEPTGEHPTCAGVGALLRAEHLGRVDERGASRRTRRAARRRASATGALIARSAPSPPSVVADPPRPTMIRFAPASSAASISSPVPVVVAAIGSLPSAPPASVSPHARAISMTAVPRCIRHSGLDRVAERAGDGRRAVGAAERVERAFAAVGERQLVAVVAELPARLPDRCGDLGRGRRAPELVDRGDDADTWGHATPPDPRLAQANAGDGVGEALDVVVLAVDLEPRCVSRARVGTAKTGTSKPACVELGAHPSRRSTRVELEAAPASAR